MESSSITMFECNGCGRDFTTKHAVRSHWRYCPMKDQVKLELQLEDLAFDEMPRWRKRAYLLEKAEYKCTKCGFSKIRDDGGCILEIDHIDADHTNNSIENLRVLCPNCHALTSNFRNWGRGNKKTSKRFRKGNTGFEEFRESILAEKKKKKDLQDELITRVVLETFNSGIIDYRKYGWIGRLNKILTRDHNLMFKAQTIGRKVKDLMPAFYENQCYQRL